jgi:tetratricopeptide (TPR) repeat protein
LFVGEIVRLLAADGGLPDAMDESWRPAIPETVKDVIGRRLRRLSPECRSTLAAASVVGRSFSSSVVETLESLTPAELSTRLDEAVAARLVSGEPGDGEARFTHALVRDALYDGLAPARRRELHRRTAEAIASLFGARTASRLSELAHHYLHAVPAVSADVAVEHAVRAGEHAQTLLAYEEAARLYVTALQTLPARAASDSALERRILLSLGAARTGAGDTPGAKDAYLRAAVVARESCAPEDFAAAALGYGGRIVWARPTGDRLVVALLEEALAALPPGATSLRARVLARLSGALRDERDPRRRIEIGELAVATAREAGDSIALLQGLLALTVAQYALEDHRLRLEVIKELRELVRAAGDKDALSEALNGEILLACAVNDFATARAQTRELVAVADERRQPSAQWFAAALEGLLALHAGRFTEAEATIAGAYERGRYAHPLESEAAYVIQLYLLRREQGRAEESYERLAATAAASPARPFFQCALAALAADLGRTTELRRLFEELAPNRFEIVPRDNEWPLSGAFLVEAARALGDAHRAEILYEELEPLAERSTANVSEGTIGAMARSLGIAAAVAGRRADAIAHLARAIEIDTETGATPWVAYAQVELADVLAEAGDVAEAASLRGDAKATALALAMPRLLARIEAVSS